MKTFPIKSYAVNNTTLSALMGLLFFAAFGLVSMVNAAYWLFASVWIYFTEGQDITRAALVFGLATFSFIMAILCRKGFVYCLGKMKQYQLDTDSIGE